MTDQTHSAQLPVSAAASAGADPSMEDILASIRRILSEDEAATPASATPDAAGLAAGEDVLELDAAMMVPEQPDPVRAAELSSPASPATLPPVASPLGSAPSPFAGAGLVGPAAEAAAVNSVAALLRTLASDRALQVRSTGPTIEELVRQGLRPLLKEWLDAHLPALVERLVRAEIERVVGRAMH